MVYLGSPKSHIPPDIFHDNHRHTYLSQDIGKMRHYFGFILALIVVVASAPTIPSVFQRASDGSIPTVSAPVGTVQGTIDPKTPSVHRFLGIPFAQPPLGPLRFSPTQRLESLPSSPFDASQPPPSCMQFLVDMTIYTQNILEFNLQGLNGTSAAISEDCLTLDVYTPTPAEPRRSDSSDPKLPVIIFLYGGAFSMGGADIPYQIPAKWVQRTQGHIVVVPTTGSTSLASRTPPGCRASRRTSGFSTSGWRSSGCVTTLRRLAVTRSELPCGARVLALCRRGSTNMRGPRIPSLMRS